MLVSEILNEDELNEKPVSLLRRGMYKLGSKLGSTRAAALGDVAKEANQLKREFGAWRAGSKIDKNEVRASHLQEFLNKKGYGDIAGPIISLALGPSSSSNSSSSEIPTLTDKLIDEILLKVVQAGFQQLGTEQSRKKGRYATGTTYKGSRGQAPSASTSARQGASSQFNPQAAIKALQGMGYTVTPPGRST